MFNIIMCMYIMINLLDWCIGCSKIASRVEVHVVVNVVDNACDNIYTCRQW